MDFVLSDVFDLQMEPHQFDLVYADPPYANCRFKYARNNKSRQWGRDGRQDFILELIALMNTLRSEKGVCAVSLSSNELRLTNLFPSKARVMTWTKPYAPFRPHVWPCYAWEPLVVWGNLPGRKEQLESKTPFDWLQAEGWPRNSKACSVR